MEYARNPPTRTAVTLTRLGDAWRREGEDGARFVRALRTFLTKLAPETLRSYSFAILEFYDWYDERRGALPTPDKIDRATAADYVLYLRTRKIGILETRLRKDATRKLDFAIYEYVRRHPGANIDDIAADLARQPDFLADVTQTRDDGSQYVERVLEVELRPGGLDRHLACLVEAHVLTRKPTVEEYRRANPHIWYTQLNQRVPAGIFRYKITELSTRGVDRAGTVRARIAALSAFWQHCITHSGENTGEDNLLTHNVWLEHFKAVSATASDRAAISRREKTPREETFVKLLATTFGKDGVPSMHLEDVRDRALLLLMYHLALRASEVSNLRRADMSRGEPRMLTIVGKRNRVRTLPVPPEVVAALKELDAKIDQLALAAEAAQRSAAPRMSRLSSQDDSLPLIPAVSRWGCASYSDRAQNESGITRQAISMMLRRRAIAAGIEPSDAEFRTVHPHGIRHLSASTSALQGTPPNIIQAVLGHTSLATTGRYLEAIQPESLMLHPTAAPVTPAAQAFVPPVQQATVEPVSVAASVLSGAAVRAQAIAAEKAAAAAQARAEAKAAAAAAAASEAAAAAAAEAVAEARAEAEVSPVFELPEAPESERIVAVGELILPRTPLPSQVEIARAEGVVVPASVATRQPPKPARKRITQEQLNEAYTSPWGEGKEGARQKMHKSTAGRTDDLLPQVLVGVRTRLPWFVGESNNLKPEMPVYNMAQLCQPGSKLAADLNDLWASWMVNPEVSEFGKRGPSAARALVEWLKYGLLISRQVDADLNATNGQWFPFEGEPTGANDLREHRIDMIVRWFQVRAWEFRVSTVRESRVATVIDKDNVPEWYADADPLASLSPEDREDLFDWIDVLSDRVPGGTTLRFRRPGTPSDSPMTLTRADFWAFLRDLWAFDAQKDELDDEVQMGLTVTVAKREALKAVDAAAQKTLAKLLSAATPLSTSPKSGVQLRRYREQNDVPKIAIARALGASDAAAYDAIEAQGAFGPSMQKLVDAFFAARKMERARVGVVETWIDADAGSIPTPSSIRKERSELRREAQQSPEGASQTTLQRAEAYSKLLEQMFGKDVANDPILKLFRPTRQRDTSLAYTNDSFGKFFNFDRKLGTIVHDPEYRTEFARKTGTHSECVARRVARHLWDVRAKRQYYESHAKELTDKIDGWAYFRVPCSVDQESELLQRLGNKASFAEEHRKMCERAGITTRSVWEDEFGEFFRSEYEESMLLSSATPVRGSESFTPNATIVEYVRNAATMIPSPVHLVLWTHLAATAW